MKTVAIVLLKEYFRQEVENISSLLIAFVLTSYFFIQANFTQFNVMLAQSL
jgi:hypothetical protein